MIDTNIFDRIVVTEAVATKLQYMVKQGLVNIITTHIQEDELTQLSDAEKRKRIASIPREVIPTSAFVLGKSRLGMARLGGNGIEEIRQGNLRHTNNALIAATAHGYADVLVTEDKTLASRVRAKQFNVAVWDYQQFFQYIMSL